MVKRRQEALQEVVVVDDGPDARPRGVVGDATARAQPPRSFTWRGRHHEVLAVLAYWRSDEGWWSRQGLAMGAGMTEIDLWRVEAVVTAARASARADADAVSRRVYGAAPTVVDLARRSVRGTDGDVEIRWTLDRTWD